jgi:hypothetical protein
MPSSSDFYNRLQDADNKLDGVNSRLDGVNGRLDSTNNNLVTIEGKLDAVVNAVNAVVHAVHQVNQTLQWGFAQLITIGNYTNQALYENDLQNDTMICILEHISQNTCALLNEAHLQTGLQQTIKENTSLLADLYAATHGDAAVARERLEALRKQVEECCPPEVPPPPCQYRPCPKDFKPVPPPPHTVPPPDNRPPG